jgi:hypothetical protein
MVERSLECGGVLQGRLARAIQAENGSALQQNKEDRIIGAGGFVLGAPKAFQAILAAGFLSMKNVCSIYE